MSAVVAATSLTIWLSNSHAGDLGVRLPLEQGARQTRRKPLDLEGRFTALSGTPGKSPGAWPRFRGSNFDNLGPEDIRFTEAWPAAGPPLLWSVDLGEGHAGPAVLHGRVFVLDYDEENGGDALRCFSLDDGKEIWRRFYPVKIKRNHGMSRTVPAVSKEAVVTMGPKCHVLCADPASGDFRWGLDLAASFGAEVPLWYTGQCPLIDGDTAVIAVGGDCLLMGVDLLSGGIVWQTPNPDRWGMSHASVFPLTLAGRRVYVYSAIGGIVGVSAQGPDTGKTLWKTSAWNHAVVAPSPVQIDHERLFVTAGYGVGSMMLRVTRDGEAFRVEEEARYDRRVFACEQQTPIFHKGRLYTVMPNDAGPMRRRLLCMTPGGEKIWDSGPENRFGLGPFMIAGDRVLVLDDRGWLTLSRTGGDRYVELAKARVLSGRDAWGPMALAGHRLLLRDWKRLVCLDLEPR